MLKGVTLKNFEDRSQLVQSKGKDTIQCAHCTYTVLNSAPQFIATHLCYTALNTLLNCTKLFTKLH